MVVVNATMPGARGPRDPRRRDAARAHPRVRPATQPEANRAATARTATATERQQRRRAGGPPPPARGRRRPRATTAGDADSGAAAVGTETSAVADSVCRVAARRRCCADRREPAPGATVGARPPGASEPVAAARRRGCRRRASAWASVSGRRGRRQAHVVECACAGGGACGVAAVARCPTPSLDVAVARPVADAAPRVTPTPTRVARRRASSPRSPGSSPKQSPPSGPTPSELAHGLARRSPAGSCSAVLLGGQLDQVDARSPAAASSATQYDVAVLPVSTTSPACGPSGSRGGAARRRATRRTGAPRGEHDRQRDRERTHPRRRQPLPARRGTGAAAPTHRPGRNGSGCSSSAGTAPIVAPSPGRPGEPPSHVTANAPQRGYCSARRALHAAGGHGRPGRPRTPGSPARSSSRRWRRSAACSPSRRGPDRARSKNANGSASNRCARSPRAPAPRRTSCSSRSRRSRVGAAVEQCASSFAGSYGSSYAHPPSGHWASTSHVGSRHAAGAAAAPRARAPRARRRTPPRRRTVRPDPACRRISCTRFVRRRTRADRVPPATTASDDLRPQADAARRCPRRDLAPAGTRARRSCCSPPDPGGHEREHRVGRRADRGERGDRAVRLLLGGEVAERARSCPIAVAAPAACATAPIARATRPRRARAGGDDPSKGPAHRALLPGRPRAPHGTTLPAGGSATGRERPAAGVPLSARVVQPVRRAGRPGSSSLGRVGPTVAGQRRNPTGFASATRCAGDATSRGTPPQTTGTGARDQRPSNGPGSSPPSRLCSDRNRSISTGELFARGQPVLARKRFQPLEVARRILVGRHRGVQPVALLLGIVDERTEREVHAEVPAEMLQERDRRDRERTADVVGDLREEPDSGDAGAAHGQLQRAERRARARGGDPADPATRPRAADPPGTPSPGRAPDGCAARRRGSLPGSPTGPPRRAGTGRARRSPAVASGSRARGRS